MQVGTPPAAEEAAAAAVAPEPAASPEADGAAMQVEAPPAAEAAAAADRFSESSATAANEKAAAAAKKPKKEKTGKKAVDDAADDAADDAVDDAAAVAAPLMVDGKVVYMCGCGCKREVTDDAEAIMYVPKRVLTSSMQRAVVSTKEVACYRSERKLVGCYVPRIVYGGKVIPNQYPRGNQVDASESSAATTTSTITGPNSATPTLVSGARGPPRNPKLTCAQF